MDYQHSHLALGGTFDLLHKGHKTLLEFAFLKAEKVSIGLVSDQMAKGKGVIQDYDARLSELAKFLHSRGFDDRAEITPIDDVYGPAIFDKSIEALVVTGATRDNGKLINKKRAEQGLSLLVLLDVPYVLTDDGEPISTTRIKQGLIDKNGLSYYAFLTRGNGFSLPENLRGELKEPFGELVTTTADITSLVDSGQKLVVVGDASTKIFGELKQNADLYIVDYKIKRIREFNSLGELGLPAILRPTNVINEPGTIQKALIDAIYDSFENLNNDMSKRSFALRAQDDMGRAGVILVDGEEDLAVVPAILLAPLGTIVCYGQPDEGMVFVHVDEDKKKEVLELLLKFGPIG